MRATQVNLKGAVDQLLKEKVELATKLARATDERDRYRAAGDQVQQKYDDAVSELLWCRALLLEADALGLLDGLPEIRDRARRLAPKTLACLRRAMGV